MTTIDMSLNNFELYDGIQIEEIAGRLNMTTPPETAVNIIGKNAAKIVSAIPADQRAEVTLTGPMAVYAYMIVFHQVVHAFRCVYYNDGKNGKVLIAKHG